MDSKTDRRLARGSTQTKVSFKSTYNNVTFQFYILLRVDGVKYNDPIRLEVPESTYWGRLPRLLTRLCSGESRGENPTMASSAILAMDCGLPSNEKIIIIPK